MPASIGNVPEKFPAGLRVLVVDDDPTCLMILDRMLRKCDYEVTKCNKAEAALSFLRENKNGFDVVISDVHMPDMDGFKLLVHIGLEMDLPVIMMSVDDSKSVVMKGVTHGACDYLIKPVRIEALRNIWQHVVRKRKYEWKDLEPTVSLDDGDQQQKQPEDHECSSSANEGHNCKNIKRRKDEEDEAEEKDDSSAVKKPRVSWTQELHEQFLAAVMHLGIDKAVPKKILDVMNVPGITRENVASHLQKFRLYLKKLKEVHSGGTCPLSMDQDAGYGSFMEHDIHSLAAISQANQLPTQNLSTLQAMALGRAGNSKLASAPLVDQINTGFTFSNPELRYLNQHGNNSNISKQMSFLHGIPTTMEQKQLAPLQPSFTGMHNNQALISMSGQSQTHNHAVRQPILPESTGNGFPCLGISPIMLASTMQQERNVEAMSSKQGFASCYGLSKTVNQQRTHDCGLQGVDLTFGPSQHRNYMQGGLNGPQHNYALGRKIMGSKVRFSAGEGCGSHVSDIPSVTMVEGVNYGTSHQQLYPEEPSQDDLITAILTQQPQQGIGPAENEYAHNWYSPDNLLA